MEDFTIIRLLIQDDDLFELRLILDQNEIEYTLLDENTVQTLPGLSHAIGGIRLQVRTEDAAKTYDLLIEHEFIEEEKPLPIVTFLEKYTAKIPVINKLRLEWRIMILVALIILLISFIFLPGTLKATPQKISETRWCLEKIEHNDLSFYPNTVEALTITYHNSCNEIVSFGEYGRIRFPGFDSRSISGNWEFYNNHIEISQADTLENVLNGIYKVDYSRHKLTLSSENTTIYCYREELGSPSINIE